MKDEQPVSFEALRELEFDSVYANNSLFELSVWDLKVFFGQLEQHTGKSVIDWHTAVTMPWMHAKVFGYYLRLNIAFHEMQAGEIKLNPYVLPPKPEPPQDPNDPKAKTLYEASMKIYTDMFG